MGEAGSCGWQGCRWRHGCFGGLVVLGEAREGLLGESGVLGPAGCTVKLWVVGEGEWEDAMLLSLPFTTQ